MDWLNEPPEWREEGGELTLVTGDRTDFWRRTHYGFVRDDGHARLAAAEGDFSATVRFPRSFPFSSLTAGGTQPRTLRVNSTIREGTFRAHLSEALSLSRCCMSE